MSGSIVIVDDHEPFRRSARALLELDGYRVVGEAGDAAEGLEVVGRLRPDIVLLDVALPDRSGLEIAAELARAGARIVLVSSRDPSDLGSRVERCGADGFIPKDQLSGDTLTELLR